MKTWFFPDGFVGDDPSSKHNARWLSIMLLFFALIMIAVSFGGCTVLAVGAGIEIEKQHRQWCRFHPYEGNCWQYR
jgi:hypothetical protein